jgi:SAM-dependent methyltransferase
MNHRQAADYLPRFVRDHIFYFEAAICDAISRFAAGLVPGARVLDAGAGEAQYAAYFRRQRYIGIDLGIGDAQWDYSQIDAIADLVRLPFQDCTFDAVINIVTLEHVTDPMRVLQELARVLKPDGNLLLVAPQDWEMHQHPYDYYRYTRYGLEYLLASAGFEALEIRAAGGYFRLLARRLLNGLIFFEQGIRRIFLIPAAALLIPPSLILPFLDTLDREKNFTLGYLCIAQKSDCRSSVVSTRPKISDL